MGKTTERIPFRLLTMPCCHGLICHVNHRLPMYCSNCGASVYPEIKGCVLIHDDTAILKYEENKKP